MIVALDRRTILASTVLAAVAGPAAAQEKITLRLAESLPAGHVIHELVAKPFMELVTEGHQRTGHVPALPGRAAWQSQGHGAAHRRRRR